MDLVSTAMTPMLKGSARSKRRRISVTSSKPNKNFLDPSDYSGGVSWMRTGPVWRSYWNTRPSTLRKSCSLSSKLSSPPPGPRSSSGTSAGLGSSPWLLDLLRKEWQHFKGLMQLTFAEWRAVREREREKERKRER